MLCDHCGENQATTVYKETINGQTKTYHLCRQCAEKLEVNSFFGHPFFDTSSLFSGFFSQNPLNQHLPNVKKCDVCGATLRQIMETGHLGCSHCMETFGTDLTPTIRKIHGNAVHTGKVPKTASSKIKVKRQIELLSEKLNKAIETQDFESAASIRDEINALKSQEEQK